jgi:hypothetical protein
MPGAQPLRQGPIEGSEPATDAELVFAVRLTETFGEVTLLAVHHLAPHHQEDAGSTTSGHQLWMSRLPPR